MQGTVDERLRNFQAALADGTSTIDVVSMLVMGGDCFALDNPTEFQLKKTVAEEFALEVSQDVFVVGSAKLGFSIAPRKRYRPFGDRSDIDLALVSSELYVRIWKQVRDHVSAGAFWPNRAKYQDYATLGWMRPDLLPPSESVPLGNRWWEFFRSLQQSKRFGPYKIAAGLFYDIDFLRRYQMRAVEACREALETE